MVARNRWRVMTSHKRNGHLPPVCYGAPSLLLLSELVPLLQPVRWGYRCRRFRWCWCRFYRPALQAALTTALQSAQLQMQDQLKVFGASLKAQRDEPGTNGPNGSSSPGGRRGGGGVEYQL